MARAKAWSKYRRGRPLVRPSILLEVQFHISLLFSDFSVRCTIELYVSGCFLTRFFTQFSYFSRKFQPLDYSCSTAYFLPAGAFSVSSVVEATSKPPDHCFPSCIGHVASAVFSVMIV